MLISLMLLIRFKASQEDCFLLLSPLQERSKSKIPFLITLRKLQYSYFKVNLGRPLNAIDLVLYSESHRLLPPRIIFEPCAPAMASPPENQAA